MTRTLHYYSKTNSLISTTSIPLSLSLIIVSVFATIAVLFTLCVSHHRKSSYSKPQTSSPSNNSSKKSGTPSTEALKTPSIQVHEVITGPGLSKIRTSRNKDKRHANEVGEEEEPESSVWRKTIILGERCKVPSDGEEEAYDCDGNKMRNYHPRTPRSLPVSRTNSFAAASEGSAF